MPPAVPQPVVAQLTRAAIFLVATINPGQENESVVRALCGDLAALLRAVGFRDLEGRLSCVMALGSEAWDRLSGEPRPKELHPFPEIRGQHHAVATPGDILFHIRSTRMDLCFELATHIMSRLNGAVSTVDEVHGFKYFDDRDLIGFVDGTENPVDQAALDATIIGDEDAVFAGGSYVIVQKYLHDVKGWNALPIEAQEKIIGRTKLADIEIDEAVKPTSAHNALTTIIEDGEQLEIVRDNMPFGEPGKGEFGTYFIGYARSPHRIEQMLVNMFVGRPPGNDDQLLDFSRAVPPARYFLCPRRRSWRILGRATLPPRLPTRRRKAPRRGRVHIATVTTRRLTRDRFAEERGRLRISSIEISLLFPTRPGLRSKRKRRAPSSAGW